MLVFEDRELLIITPPHTASGNMHRACSEAGARWVVGPAGDGTVDHHYAEIAAGWRDFRIAVVARHPLDRAIGLYEHHMQVTERQGWDAIGWWQYVAMVLCDHDDLSWFYKQSISELLGDREVDEVIKFENLQADAERVVGLPLNLREGWSVDRTVYLRQVAPCCQVQWLYEDDMQRFGYSPLV